MRERELGESELGERHGIVDRVHGYIRYGLSFIV